MSYSGKVKSDLDLDLDLDCLVDDVCSTRTCELSFAVTLAMALSYLEANNVTPPPPRASTTELLPPLFIFLGSEARHLEHMLDQWYHNGFVPPSDDAHFPLDRAFVPLTSPRSSFTQHDWIHIPRLLVSLARKWASRLPLCRKEMKSIVSGEIMRVNPRNRPGQTISFRACPLLYTSTETIEFAACSFAWLGASVDSCEREREVTIDCISHRCFALGSKHSNFITQICTLAAQCLGGCHPSIHGHVFLCSANPFARVAGRSRSPSDGTIRRSQRKHRHGRMQA